MLKFQVDLGAATSELDSHLESPLVWPELELSVRWNELGIWYASDQLGVQQEGGSQKVS